jgi:hypothetical protein
MIVEKIRKYSDSMNGKKVGKTTKIIDEMHFQGYIQVTFY